MARFFSLIWKVFEMLFRDEKCNDIYFIVETSQEKGLLSCYA